MSAAPTTFWDDLAEDLKDPDFLRAYIVESLRIETINRLVNDLNEACEELSMSKAALARAISTEPAVVRRLLSSGHRNPTIGTIAEVAAALGMRVTLEPLPPEEKSQITTTLREGSSKNRRKLAKAMAKKRSSGKNELCAT